MAIKFGTDTVTGIKFNTEGLPNVGVVRLQIGSGSPQAVWAASRTFYIRMTSEHIRSISVTRTAALEPTAEINVSIPPSIWAHGTRYDCYCGDTLYIEAQAQTSYTIKYKYNGATYTSPPTITLSADLSGPELEIVDA